MEYKDLRKLFHIDENSSRKEYEARFNAKETIHLGFKVAGSEAFCCMDSEIYRLIIQSERLNKQIDEIASKLPGGAVEQYLTNCLIDEVVLTNEIEGVNSSRREIGEILTTLSRNDKNGRFRGIVEKYLMLRKNIEIPLNTCADIRDIYNELVLEEVVTRKASNAPDGKLFRKGPVDVYDAAQRPIHHGIEPEEKIIEMLGLSLDLLKREEIEMLVRVSLFHFLFAYIHPFYDGNGRTNRFISSYFLTREFNPLVGYRLSYSVKERIDKYYKGFSLCEHELNRGDLTPFVILFSEIIVDAMTSMKESLAERRHALKVARESIKCIPNIADGKKKSVDQRITLADYLIQAALFADVGITTKELASLLKLSVPSTYDRLKFFSDIGLLKKQQVGRTVMLSMNLDALAEVAATSLPSNTQP